MKALTGKEIYPIVNRVQNPLSHKCFFTGYGTGEYAPSFGAYRHPASHTVELG
jgi:hypothetical protein